MLYMIFIQGGSEKMLTEEDEIYLKAAMPGWLYIDTRNISEIKILEIDQDKREFVVSGTVENRR